MLHQPVHLWIDEDRLALLSVATCDRHFCSAELPAIRPIRQTFAWWTGEYGRCAKGDVVVAAEADQVRRAN